MLTKQQKRDIVLIAKVGCDRETAAQYAEATLAQLVEACREDELFAKHLAAAEATAELAHMQNVQQASKEEKNWRASVWWLERRMPERYGRRDAESITPGQLQKFLALLAGVVAEEVTDAHDRQRLMERMRTIALSEKTNQLANFVTDNENVEADEAFDR